MRKKLKKQKLHEIRLFLYLQWIYRWSCRHTYFSLMPTYFNKEMNTINSKNEKTKTIKTEEKWIQYYEGIEKDDKVEGEMDNIIRRK